ncbi:MAG: ABC transporter ATP-binding protein [Actinobacteria bacterium]|nr:ABC transporter ATP-binding protein [Actinomycetota bacterium]
MEVEGLSKRYGPDVVLDDVSFSVDRGEFVALVGRSGSGKSTLIHLLGGLEPPDSGVISVDGVSLRHHGRTPLAKFRRTHVGIVFQLHNLIPRLTAVQNVELAMFSTGRSRHRRREHALELLERLDLAHRANRRPPQLSGGERARVALARGLANDPPVLLADEPTGSLDDEAADRVGAQLTSLAREGVTVLCVSHDARLNDRADRTLRLADGKVAPSTD